MRTLVVAAALAWASAVQAQSVTVRGGEHENFSRLVLRTPEGAGWNLTPRQGGFELELPDSVVFDLRRAFDRIPRDRIEALRPLGKGRLALSVTCDCHAEAVLLRDVGLVIDVIDGPAPPGALVPGLAEPAVSAAGLPLLLEMPAEPPPFSPLTSVLEDPSQGIPAVDPAEEERVAQTEAAILESVAAAASQGLLDVAPAQGLPEPPSAGQAEVLPSPTVVVSEAEPTAEAPREDAGLPAPASGATRPGISFRTGMETGSASPPRLGPSGTPCLAKDVFDFAAWAGSGDFDTEIAPRLLQISDDRDRLDPEAVEALARTYLAFGFGREAAATLDTDGAASRERDGLRLLARLVDGEAVSSDALDDQAGCLGPVALWRALARNTLDGTDERERAAITIALHDLPSALRPMIVVRLADLLLEANDPLGAAEIMALAEGAGAEASVIKAEVIRDTEGAAPALAELESLAERDSRMTPEGLVELIDLTVAQGRPVPEETLELARALRFEQGGDAARMLLLAEARALTADLRVGEAMALLEQERSSWPGEDLDAALVATAEALTEELADATFLEYALGQLPPDLPPAAREIVATRLADLGFPQEADALRTAASSDSLESSGHSDSDGTTQSAPRLEFPVSESASAQIAAEDEAGASRSGGSGTDWQPPPPPAQERPVLEIEADPGPSNQSPASQDVVLPAREQATAGAPVVLPEAGPEGASSAPDLAATLTTLAARRALLDQAGEARARAAALLGQPTIE